MRSSASDSVSFIFTGSYHSTLVITTPTATPLPVKTSLYCLWLARGLDIAAESLSSVTQILAIFRESFFESAAVHFHRK